MSDLSEQYIFLRGEVQGKKKLDSNEVNPLLRQYRQLLNDFKVEERRGDGKITKIWTDHVDEFTSELFNDGRNLLFSHKLKINIFDPHPHSFNNYAHSIQIKISRLKDIQVEDGRIVIITTGIKFSGCHDGREGRWPMEKMYGIGI